MPSHFSYPGVYVEEIPSSVRPVTGVSTSETAFIDVFARGPINQAIRITSFSDFERRFGGIDQNSEASYAIRQYFLNGGSIAWVIRVFSKTLTFAHTILAGASGDPLLKVEAASPGSWAAVKDRRGVRLLVDHNTSVTTELFNLMVQEFETVGSSDQVTRTEVFRNLSTKRDHPRFVEGVVNNSSELVKITVTGEAGSLPKATTAAQLLAGELNDATAAQAEWEPGLASLDKITPSVFSILCIPAAANLDEDRRPGLLALAIEACVRHRAFFLIDVPPGTQPERTAIMEGIAPSPNAAIYYPRLLVADPLNDNGLREVGPSGTVAGIFARTDAGRGVWKAPAGTDARIRGASLTDKINDAENGALNPAGINVLRSFPVFGDVVWGARTLEGSDVFASQWKYIPVRRTALFLEESLYASLKWVVFEPNDERLWSQIRLNVGAFLQDLFVQGAFQGNTPSKAYFVKCDGETTTQTDIDRGVVNIVVGFAPLKPAEFVVIKLQQMSGHSQ